MYFTRRQEESLTDKNNCQRRAPFLAKSEPMTIWTRFEMPCHFENFRMFAVSTKVIA